MRSSISLLLLSLCLCMTITFAYNSTDYSSALLFSSLKGGDTTFHSINALSGVDSNPIPVLTQNVTGRALQFTSPIQSLTNKQSRVKLVTRVTFGINNAISSNGGYQLKINNEFQFKFDIKSIKKRAYIWTNRDYSVQFIYYRTFIERDDSEGYLYMNIDKKYLQDQQLQFSIENLGTNSTRYIALLPDNAQFNVQNANSLKSKLQNHIRAWAYKTFQGVINGVDRSKSIVGTKGQWYNHDGKYASNIMLREDIMDKSISWSSKPTYLHKQKTAKFVISLGMGYASQPKSSGFTFNVGKFHAFQFDLVRTNSSWSSKDMRVTAVYVVTFQNEEDTAGLLYLTVDNTLLDEGKATKFSIVSNSKGSLRYVALYPDRHVLGATVRVRKQYNAVKKQLGISDDFSELVRSKLVKRKRKNTAKKASKKKYLKKAKNAKKKAKKNFKRKKSRKNAPFKWVRDNWSACSAKCGGGKRRRSVHCVDKKDVTKRLPNDACSSLVKKRPRRSKPCNTQSCVFYKWKKSPWSACSKTCGGGEKKRKVVCTSIVGKDKKSSKNPADAFCVKEVGTKPKTVKKCNKLKCASTYKYKKGKWSKCSKKCGGGVQTRPVACYGDNKKKYNKRECHNLKLKEPKSKRKCNPKRCVKHRYATSAWSTCSKKCNGGKQTRKLSCVADDGQAKTKVKATKCKKQKKPILERNCHTHQCPKLEWNLGNWTKCDQFCGGGQQTRILTCVDLINNVLLNRTTCGDAPAPRAVRACNTQTCPTFQWARGAWSTCTATCNAGTQTRKIVCEDDTGKHYKSAICKKYVKQHEGRTKRICNSQPCLALNITAQAVILSFTPNTKLRKRDYRHSIAADIGSVCSISPWRVKLKSYLKSANSTDVAVIILPTYSSASYQSPEQCVKTIQSQHQATTANLLKKGDITSQLKASSDIVTRQIYACNDKSYALSCGQGANAYRWIFPTRWSKCSHGCGGGTQSKKNQCKKHNGMDALLITCSTLLGAAKNADVERPCNTQTCIGNWKWAKGDWGQCTAKCGGGQQTREIKCSASDGTHTLAECATRLGNSTQPVTVRACGTQVCPDYKLVTSDWSGCSKWCGGGVKTRTVTCVSNDGSVPSEEDCKKLTPPVISKACNTQKCVVYSWLAAPWTDTCSKKCGGGVYTRAITCQTDDGNTVGNDQCDKNAKAPQPDAVKACNTLPCITYNWETSLYGKCSATCGGGLKTRSVKCTAKYSATNTTALPPLPVPDFSACVLAHPDQRRPISSQACNTAACPLPGEAATTSNAIPSKTKSKSAKLTNTASNFRFAHKGAAAVKVDPAIVWSSTPWTTCDRECGAGSQIRSVNCMSSAAGVVLTHDQCAHLSQPPSKRFCNTKPCEGAAQDSSSAASLDYKYVSTAYHSTAKAESMKAEIEELKQRIAAAYQSYGIPATPLAKSVKKIDELEKLVVQLKADQAIIKNGDTYNGDRVKKMNELVKELEGDKRPVEHEHVHTHKYVTKAEKEAIANSNTATIVTIPAKPRHKTRKQRLHEEYERKMKHTHTPLYRDQDTDRVEAEEAAATSSIDTSFPSSPYDAAHEESSAEDAYLIHHSIPELVRRVSLLAEDETVLDNHEQQSIDDHHINPEDLDQMFPLVPDMMEEL